MRIDSWVDDSIRKLPVWRAAPVKWGDGHRHSIAPHVLFRTQLIAALQRVVRAAAARRIRTARRGARAAWTRVEERRRCDAPGGVHGRRRPAWSDDIHGRR